LGRHVGTAIIAYDSAVDWHKDQRRGAFNPLPDGEESVSAALALARCELLQAALKWREQCDEESHVGRVLDQVARRMPGSCGKPACQRFRNQVDTQQKRWGLGRRGLQLNEGFDVAVGLCSFLAIIVAALTCCITSSKKSAAERAKEADVPPSTGEPTSPQD